MNYLLDTNTISELYDTCAKYHFSVIRRLRSLTDMDQVSISILSLYELEYGWANAPDDKKPSIRQMITETQTDFFIHTLSPSGALLFGTLKKHIKDELSPSKENMKKYNVDMMLAATAIITQSRLVSNDFVFSQLKQFVSNIETEDWMV